MSTRCFICMDIITENCDTRITTCGHLFHYHCVRSWLERADSCPECRSPIYENQLSKIYLNFTHEFEDESLRLELDSTNAALSILKDELKALKSVADQAEKHQNKCIIMEKDLTIMQLELQITKEKNKQVEMLYNDSQNQLNQFKAAHGGFDKSNDTIFSLRKTLKITTAKLTSFEKIIANQAESLKKNNNILLQLVLSKNNSADNHNNEYNFIKDVLKNQNLIEKLLDNKSYFEQSISNKEFIEKCFKNKKLIEKCLNDNQNKFIEEHINEKCFFIKPKPNIKKVNSEEFFGRDKSSRYFNLHKSSRYFDAKRIPKSRPNALFNEFTTKNMVANTTLEEMMLVKAKEKKNNDEITKDV